jgi:hypothetical protein
MNINESELFIPFCQYICELGNCSFKLYLKNPISRCLVLDLYKITAKYKPTPIYINVSPFVLQRMFFSACIILTFFTLC